MIEHPSLETATSGSIRFNTDSSKLEIYDGNAWFEIDSTSPDEQTGGTRGLTAAGFGNTDQIEFFNIDTTGDGTDFGDLNNSIQQPLLLLAANKSPKSCASPFDAIVIKSIISACAAPLLFPENTPLIPFEVAALE